MLERITAVFPTTTDTVNTRHEDYWFCKISIHVAAMQCTGTVVEMKQFSDSTHSPLERVTDAQAVVPPQFTTIDGYVVVQYGWYGWLGCTMAVDAEAGSVTVKFLHPHLPSSSFSFPEPPDMLEVDSSDIVSLVNPVTATGRTYTLTKREMAEAAKIIAPRT